MDFNRSVCVFPMVMKSYNGTWIVFKARDGEVFRDFVAARNDMVEAITNAASIVESKGLRIPKDVRMFLEDASMPVSPYRKKSKRHFTAYVSDTIPVRKLKKG